MLHRHVPSVVCFGLLSLGLAGLPESALADISQMPAVRTFIQYMHGTHGFPVTQLDAWFAEVKIREDILKYIARPAEKKPWYQYRPIFMREARITQGVEFWRKHLAVLARAEQQYGVPPAIIVSIIGVETGYGNNTGRHRVMDALATLAFSYPRRADFFRDELVQYLLLCREQGLDPTILKGSYAGAMGLPQFISSSYRHYAVDFDDDGRIDIWNNISDAIGSVANYFHQHGWQPDDTVALPVSARGKVYRNLLDQDLRFRVRFSELERHGVHSSHSFPQDTLVNLLELRLEDGVELWMTLDNFYVITRYNHSALYAMVVHQLAIAIQKRHRSAQDL